MTTVNYYETLFYRLFQEKMAERRMEILESLASGLDREEYLRAIGRLNELAVAVNLAKEVAEKIRSRE